ncbi:MAG TPA: PEP-CTERM sorting domain-containing protein [Verrucomicrobiae bacterium]|nr:PEP-CTERM sorting domain-containing protein [Verrucomicrobiae bacterium]
MKNTIKVVLAVVGLAGSLDHVNAQNAQMTIYDGVNPLITIFDNGPGDILGMYGGIYVSTQVGVWNLTISSAITKPLFGSSTAPVMDINVQASSTAAGTLTYSFSDNNFTPANNPGVVNATLSGGLTYGSATAQYRVYGDPNNLVGATTVPLVNIGPNPLSTLQSSTGGFSLPQPLSFTQVITLTAAQASNFSIDASFNVIAVPEPSSLVLAGLGGAAVLTLFRRRNN